MPTDPMRPAWRRIAPIVLIAFATLGLLAAISETVARLVMRQSTTSTMQCLIVDDPATGVRGIANSFCRQKTFETPLIDYRFNECGFRTPQSCTPAPAGTTRIVLIGSSLAFGMHVQQPESFAALLGPMLSARLGRPIDLFNESMQWGFPASLALRTDAILRPHPDVILWALTPFDIENIRTILPYVPGKGEGLSLPAHGGATPAPPPPKGLLTLPGRAWRRLIGVLADTRTVTMLQHYLYLSPSQYLGHTLTQAGTVDYLRNAPTPELRGNIATFADAVARVAARAKAAGVPLIVTLLPSRPQAILLSNRSWDAGYDPNRLGQLLRPIVEAQGARYVDMTDGLATAPDAGELFYPMDEHPVPAGHRLMATLLTNALVRSNAIPEQRR